MGRMNVWEKFNRWLKLANEFDLKAKRAYLDRIPQSILSFRPYSDVQRMISMIDDRLLEKAVEKRLTIKTMIRPHIHLIATLRQDGMSWQKIADVLQARKVIVKALSLRSAVLSMPEWKELNPEVPAASTVIPLYKDIVKLRLEGKPWVAIVRILKNQHGIIIDRSTLMKTMFSITDRLVWSPAKPVSENSEKVKSAPRKKTRAKGAAAHRVNLETLFDITPKYQAKTKAKTAPATKSVKKKTRAR